MLPRMSEPEIDLTELASRKPTGWCRIGWVAAACDRQRWDVWDTCRPARDLRGETVTRAHWPRIRGKGANRSRTPRARFLTVRPTMLRDAGSTSPDRPS